MNQILQGTYSDAIVYPESDGKPMADNTKQARWILVLYSNLAMLYHEVAKSFVAADLLWYPVEGHPEICTAPDVLVVLGRDQYDRKSYQQWNEDNIPVTVAFEILSPGNTAEEIIDKIGFYEDHGTEELYLYNPESSRLHLYLRRGEMLMRKREANGFVSPRLGIRFDLSGPEMVVYLPDGRPFLTLTEMNTQRLAEQLRAQQAEQRADLAQQRAARLSELGRKARRGLASPEELTELECLEDEQMPPAR